MSEELKPCPFCGKPGELVDAKGLIHLETRDDFACCTDVTCMPMPMHFDVSQWNTRPIEDALRAELARMTAVNATFSKALRIISGEDEIPYNDRVSDSETACDALFKARELP